MLDKRVLQLGSEEIPTSTGGPRGSQGRSGMIKNRSKTGKVIDSGGKESSSPFSQPLSPPSNMPDYLHLDIPNMNQAEIEELTVCLNSSDQESGGSHHSRRSRFNQSQDSSN